MARDVSHSAERVAYSWQVAELRVSGRTLEFVCGRIVQFAHIDVCFAGFREDVDYRGRACVDDLGESWDLRARLPDRCECGPLVKEPVHAASEHVRAAPREDGARHAQGQTRRGQQYRAAQNIRWRLDGARWFEQPGSA